jgi:hypothetical protein
MMFRNKFRAFSRRPKFIILGLAIVVAAAATVLALWVGRSTETSNAATEPPLAARLENAEGNVSIAQYAEDAAGEDADEDADWFKAIPNSPLTPGDRIYTGDDSRARVAFNARNYASVNPLTSLDLLSLTDQQTQLALRNGSAIFDVGDLESGELFEVATPQCAVDFIEPGLYQIGIEDGGSTIISVLSGLAQVVGPDGTGQLSAGEVLTVAGAIASEALASRLSPEVAGGIVDGYYRDRYPDSYDGRYVNYDVYLDEPDYYDPYDRSVSYDYVGWDEVPGLYDLDRYGDWIDVADYGRCWSPRVDAGWAPYRHGSWRVHDIWGPSWVSTEPWGWAPYHYGRWAYVDHRGWVWVPDRVSRRVYSPALVAFVPLDNQIGWCPLAPGERYIPRYYSDYQPHYFADQVVVREVVYGHRSYRNLSIPGCVTAAPIDSFARFTSRPWSRRVESYQLANVQPVLDPFAITNVRDIAKQARRSRRSGEIGSNFTGRFRRTAVVTSTDPVVLPVQSNLRQRFRAEAVGEKQRKARVKFRETGEVTSALRSDGIPRAPIVAVRRQRVDKADQNQGLTRPRLDGNSQTGSEISREQARQLRRQQKAARRSQGPMPPTREVRPTSQPPTTRQEMKRQRREQRQLQRRVPTQQPPAVPKERRTKPPRRPDQNLQQNQSAAARVQMQRARPAQPTVNQRLEQRQIRRATKQAERQNRVFQSQPRRRVPNPSVQQATAIKAQRQQQNQTARQAQMQRQAMQQHQQMSRAREAERQRLNQAGAQRQQMQVRRVEQMRQQKRQVTNPPVPQRQPMVQRVEPQRQPRQVQMQPPQRSMSVPQQQREKSRGTTDAPRSNGGNGRKGKNN